MIEESTITGNSTSTEGNLAVGGGIKIHTYDTGVEIRDSVITGNESTKGGGIYAKAFSTSVSSLITIENSTISGNKSQDQGGGIYADLLGIRHDSSIGQSFNLVNSTVSYNEATSNQGGGAWIKSMYGGTINIENSTVSHNKATNTNATTGGGLWIYSDAKSASDFGVINLVNSTVSYNEATLGQGGGACITSKYGIFNATNCTISGNSALDPGTADDGGGGLWIKNRHLVDDNEDNNPTINHVTITNNYSPKSGGLYSDDQSLEDGFLIPTLKNTIVSDNRVAKPANSDPNNIGGMIDLNSSYNLLGSGGDADLPPPGSPLYNIHNDDPHLSPLVYNGGLTKTHMPSAASLVVDAGDELAVAGMNGIPLYDQRGNPYTRVFDGKGTLRIDIGAVEYGVGTPRVTDVVLEGSSWNRDPFSFSSIVDAGEQFKSIYTEGIDTIKIQFSEDVIFPSIGGQSEGDELTLFQTVDGPSGRVTAELVGNDSFTYDSDNLTGIWTFSAPLADGKYAIHLTTAVTGGGEDLDGEWANDDNDVSGSALNPNTPDDLRDDVGKAFISGDGIAGGAFRFHFAVLQGDYDQNRIVDSTDAESDVVKDGDGDGIVENESDGHDTLIATGNEGHMLRLRAFDGADFNDDEIVDGADLGIWQDNFGNGDGTQWTWDGDANNSGYVEGMDFVTWQLVYGDESAWYTGSSHVPEGGPVPEFLEGTAPKITNLIFSGSNSQHDPFSFDTVDGSGEQLRTVPVGGADTISITFNELVDVSADSLSILGLYTANLPQLAEFSYDNITMTATWRFESWALGDQYLITLADTVTDIEGELLDGEWTNPASIDTVNGDVSEFPSGDGTAGGSFNFIATLLPGDANLDGTVNAMDAGILFENWDIPFGALFEEGDFNGDGVINAIDAGALFENFHTNLQEVWILADLDGNFNVDQDDIDTIEGNIGMPDPDYTDGDLDGDGDVDAVDLALAEIQFGLEITLAFS